MRRYFQEKATCVHCNQLFRYNELIMKDVDPYNAFVEYYCGACFHNTHRECISCNEYHTLTSFSAEFDDHICETCEYQKPSEVARLVAALAEEAA